MIIGFLVSFAFFILFRYIGLYPIGNLLLIWITSFAVSFGFFYAFNKVTSHRGMFHSIPAALIFGFGFSLLFYYIFNFDAMFSWYFGMFVFFGYLVHLILDEIYSVDLSNRRIKRSFGTALKLYSKDTKSTLLFYILVGVLFWQMPQKREFINSWTKFDIIANYKKIIRNIQR